jgi:hypothetical protein
VDRDLVPVAQFSDWSEAHIACGFLKANGLQAVLHDTNLVSIGLPVGQGVSGIKLMVPKDEAREASLLLQDVASGAAALSPDSLS